MSNVCILDSIASPKRWFSRSDAMINVCIKHIYMIFQFTSWPVTFDYIQRSQTIKRFKWSIVCSEFTWNIQVYIIYDISVYVMTLDIGCHWKEKTRSFSFQLTVFNKSSMVMFRYDFLEVMQYSNRCQLDLISVFEQCSNQLQFDLITLLVNFSRKLWQIITRYNILEARRIIFSNVWINSNLSPVSSVNWDM